MSLIVIVNATMVTMDGQRRIFQNGGLAFEGDRILAVGTAEEIESQYPHPEKRIDASGQVVIPGLVNAHTHSFQSLLKGLADDLNLLDFLQQLIYPIGEVITVDDIYVGALLTCVEAIKSGTTCLVDNQTVCASEEAADKIAQAYEQTGMRGIIARGIRQWNPRCEKWNIPRHEFVYSLEEEIRLTEKLMDRWSRSTRLRVCPAPLTIFTCGPEPFIEAKKLSAKYEVPVHAHIAETASEVESTLEDYGQREVEFLYSLKVLGPRFHLVHGVWLSDDEIQMLAATGTHVIHCPISNMYLGSGVAPIPQMLELGVNVALGSDGIGNYNHDLFAVMRASTLLHKATNRDATVIPANQALEMATLGGAKALGLDQEIGSIEPGKKADLVLINLRQSHLVPVHRVTSALVHGVSGADVTTVIINGRLVMEQRQMRSSDERAVIAQAEAVGNDLVRRAGIRSVQGVLGC
jgi:5-methylthioadenosine/S-adenosylhomocysteine deaminase